MDEAPKKNKVGRPPCFEEKKDKVLHAIRKGATYELACNYAGIDYNTFNKWRMRKEPEYLEFIKQLKEAEGETALIWLDKLDSAMDVGNWQAAAWKLERRYSKSYSNNVGVIEANERMDKLERKLKAKAKLKQENKDV